MAYLLSSFAIILGLKKRKNKILFVAVLILIFILLGWSIRVADYGIYFNRFYNYMSVSKTTEPLFHYLMYIFNKLHLEYEHFVLFSSLVYVLTVYYICKKYANNAIVFPLAMMIVFPLCMDAVQKRQTLAMCIMWIAVSFLYSISEKKKSMILFVIFCIIAAMVHISCAFCLVFVIAKMYDTKKVWLITLIITVILFAVGPLTLKSIGINFFSEEKLNRVFNMNYGTTSKIITWIRMTIIFLSYYFLYYITKVKQLRPIDEFQVFVYKINICMFTIFPLILFTNDFYRLQQISIIFNYCAISRWLISYENNDKYRINKNNFMYIFVAIIFAFINLYFLVLRSNNINTVFRAVFENNEILSLF